MNCGIAIELCIDWFCIDPEYCNGERFERLVEMSPFETWEWGVFITIKNASRVLAWKFSRAEYKISVAISLFSSFRFSKFFTRHFLYKVMTRKSFWVWEFFFRVYYNFRAINTLKKLFCNLLLQFSLFWKWKGETIGNSSFFFCTGLDDFRIVYIFFTTDSQKSSPSAYTIETILSFFCLRNRKEYRWKESGLETEHKPSNNKSWRRKIETPWNSQNNIELRRVSIILNAK